MLVHRANIAQKEQHHTKYQDPISKTYLAEIRAEYNAWLTANNQLIGPKISTRQFRRKYHCQTSSTLGRI